MYKFLVSGAICAGFLACNGATTQQLLDADFSGFDKSAPTVLYPVGENPLLGLTQTIVWTAKSGAGRYEFKLFANPERTELISNNIVTGNTFTLTFPESKTYYFSLRVLTSSQYTYGTMHALDAIYVYCPAGATCSDTGRVGTKNLPFQTLEGAATQAQKLDFSPIRIAARDTTATAAYSQTTATIGNGKSVYGGFSPDFSVRSPATYRTLIQNISEFQAVLSISGATKSAVIDGVTWRGIISIEYSGQKLIFTNNTFETNNGTGQVYMTNAGPMFRSNSFKVPVDGLGMTATFLENTFNVSANTVVNMGSYLGNNHSRPVIIGNTFYNNSPMPSRVGIKVTPAQASAVIVKNFVNPGGSSGTCYAVQLSQGPLQVHFSGNTVAMPNSPGSTGEARVLDFASSASTTNSFHNNILLSNGAGNNYLGYEDTNPTTPELWNNLGLAVGGGVFGKWFDNPGGSTNFNTLGVANISTGTLATHFVDWDGSDNNSNTPDNDQSLLAGSTALNQGVACGSLATRNQVWGFAGSQSDCTLRFPGSAYSFGQCETNHLKDVVEILDDGIGNDNGLCEANEACLYNPNMGAYWGHGNLVDAGCNVSGVISGVTLKKYAQNGY